MEAKDYVEKLDWESAIAAATLELESPKKKGQTTQITPAESYLYRGIARCFTPDKEGKHKEAIEDLSKAIVKCVGSDMDKAYYYRAYAFYLDGNYEKAIEDCNNQIPYKDELLGKIYSAMGKYKEAAENLNAAVKWWFKQKPASSNSKSLFTGQLPGSLQKDEQRIG